MEKRVKIDADLLEQIDVINTLAGGVPEPRVKMNKTLSELSIEIKIPGLNAKKLKAEVIDRRLNLYHRIHTSQYKDMIVQHSPVSILLPKASNAEEIEAYLENGQVIFKVPLNKEYKTFKKKIRIKRKEDDEKNP